MDSKKSVMDNKKSVPVPKIVSPWRELYVPHKHGDYVNDHSIIQSYDGKWYLFGITAFSANGNIPSNERYFTMGRLEGKLADGTMTELGKVIDTGLRAWAPAVIKHNGLYYMYYGPGITRMAVTNDPTHWMDHQVRIEGEPVMAVNRDHMVIEYDGGWLMYASGLKDGYSCISLLRSDDLVNWTFSGYALTSSDDAPLNPPWGAFESPFVLKRGELYYLFLTYTDCKKENYHNTLVFCSKDPTCFGNYTLSNHADTVVAELPAHAAEVICEDGRYFITSAGWRNHGAHCEGGVAIAELKFA